MMYQENCLFHPHYNTMLAICIKALCHPPFLNLHPGLISKCNTVCKVDKSGKEDENYGC